jgi:uncharacterized DUF497 family protein
MIRFEWDTNKAIANLRKHGVSFGDAITVFSDEFARIIYDPDHSKNEDRFVLLGMSATARLLVVCHCYRENDELIRIISARKADKHEAQLYGRYKP